MAKRGSRKPAHEHDGGHLSRAGDTSAVRRAADQLRAMILSKPEGAYLGSQGDLLEMLGVGKVTLQQTARLLEHEALIEVRRGVHGGYFKSRPDINLVTHAASLYLHAKPSRPGNYHGIARAISTELMSQATRSGNQPAWDRLAALEQRVAEPASLDQSMIESGNIAEFFDILYVLADNPLGEMFMRVNARLFFGTPTSELLLTDEAKWRYHKLRLQMVRALLDRDADYARLLADRLFGFMIGQTAQAPRPGADDLKT